MEAPIFNYESSCVEAEFFRDVLERNRNKGLPLIRGDFPVMSCKLASLLFAYHLLNLWPDLVVYGVCGFARDNRGDETISHYWLEVQGFSFDITADQYNLIDSRELNEMIVKSRPFSRVSLGRVGSIINYRLFRVSGRDKYVHGFSELAVDFFDDLRDCYEEVCPGEF